MRIRKLTLVNYISHRESTLNFSDFINVIIGPNGAGKSSILDAIYFALYKESRRGNLYSLLRRSGGVTERRAIVSLTFVQDNIEYTVRRELERTDGEAKTSLSRILVGRGIVAEGASNVTKEIQRIIGVDKNIFLNAVYVGQGELDKFLGELTPAERRRAFFRLIGLSEIEKIIEILKKIRDNFFKASKDLDYFRKIIREKKKILEEREKELMERDKELKEKAIELDALKKSLKGKERLLREKEDAASRLKVLERELRERRERLSALEREVREIMEKLGELGELEKRFAELKDVDEKLDLLESMFRLEEEIRERFREVETLREKRRRLEQLEAEIRELRRLEKELEMVEGQLDSLLKEKESLSKDHGAVEAGLRELEKQKGEIEREMGTLKSVVGEADKESISQELESLKGRSKKLTEKLTELKEERSRIQGEIRVIKGEIDKLESKGDRCPTCGKPLTPAEKDRIIAEKRSTMQSLGEHFNELDSKIKVIEKELKTMEERIPELEKRMEIIEKIGDLKEKLKRVEIDLKEMKGKLEGIDESLRKVTSRIDELTERKKKLTQKIGELRMREGEAESLKRELQVRESGEITKLIQEGDKAYREKREKLDELRKQYFHKYGELPVYDVKALEEMRYKREEKKRIEEKLREFGELKGKLKGNKEQIAFLRKEIGEKEEEAKKLRSVAEGLEALREEVNRLKEELHKITGEHAALISRIQQLKEREIPYLKKEIEGFAQKVKELELKQKAGNLADNIRGKLDREIKERYNASVLNAVRYNLPMYLRTLGLEIERVELDGSLNLRLVTPSGNVIAFGELSGGEKVIVSLGFRLALLTAIASGIGKRAAIPEPPPLLLDEPTIYLDEKHRKSVIKALQEIQNKKATIPIPQMIIVSHYEDLQEAADKVFIVEKTHEGSRVEEVVSPI